MMGKKRGPGGRLGLEMEVGRNRERRGLRRKETQRAMRTRNQVSMVNRMQSPNCQTHPTVVFQTFCFVFYL